jgi:hypothetical protein
VLRVGGGDTRAALGETSGRRPLTGIDLDAGAPVRSGDLTNRAVDELRAERSAATRDPWEHETFGEEHAGLKRGIPNTPRPGKRFDNPRTRASRLQ